MFLMLFSCREPVPVEPRPRVELLTTSAEDPATTWPDLQGLHTWRLATRGNVRSDLASLLTGLPYTEHGISDPVSHTLAVPLPPVELRGEASWVGADEDWGFEQGAPVVWAHEQEPGDADVHVLVGFRAHRVVWVGEGPDWEVSEVDAVDIGRAIRALVDDRPLPRARRDAPIAGPLGGEQQGPVVERVLPLAERRRWIRVDTDIVGTHTGDLDAVLRAAAALDRRELLEAEERLDILPRSPAALGLRSELLWLRGRPFEAVWLLEESFERAPSGTMALAIAEHWEELRQPEAQRWYGRTLELAPGQPDAELALWRWDRDPARLARMSRPAFERAMALEALESGIPIHSDDPILAARSLQVQGRTPEALEAMLALVAARPRSIERRVLAARWALELGEVETTQRLLGPVLRWLPNDRELRALMHAAESVDSQERTAVEALRRQWRWRR